MGSSPLARGGPTRRRTGARAAGLIPARAGRTGKLLEGSDTAPGSSPLARGGHRLATLGGELGGLIPARAGRTPSRDHFRPARWAHPRSRGADHLSLPANRREEGSSPLARGGHGGTHAAAGRAGLIPARAGRTLTAARRTSSGRAHPRSRGADAAALKAAVDRAGSSPLARGGRRLHARSRIPRGLIPARAGRTTLTLARTSPLRAHPRSRGADVSPSFE